MQTTGNTAMAIDDPVKANGKRHHAELVDWRGLGEIRQQWKSLAARALEPNVFYDPDFALPTIEALELTGDIQAVLVWRSDSANTDPDQRILAGIFPYQARRRWGVPFWVGEAFIHPYAMSSAPLVDSSNAEDTLQAFIDWLDDDPRAPAAWLFRYLPGDDALHDAIGTVAGRGGCLLQAYGSHERAVLDTAGLDTDYLEEAISHKSRKEYQRYRRKLAGYGIVEVTRAQFPADVDMAMPEFLALEASGWKGRRGTAAASSPATKRMFEQIAGGLGSAGQCRIDAIRIDGKPIAMAVSCREDGRWWLWKIAYDEEYARFSPGVLLVLYITETALEDEAPEYFDSCALPGHPMIERIWRQRRPYADILLTPPRLGPARRVAMVELESLRRHAEWAAREVRRLSGRK